MYGRATIIDGKPDRIDAGIAFIRDKVVPFVDGLPGSLGLSAWVNRETGRCVVISAWQDEASREASAEKIAPQRMEASSILGGDARAETWELAEMHQAGPDRAGYVSRVVSMSGDPSTVDKGIAAFRARVVPQVSLLPGFNTISLMVDRTHGRSRIATTYTSRSAAEAAREAGAAIRSATSAELGLTVEDVEDLELVHVGIRRPDVVPRPRTTIELPKETSV